MNSNEIESLINLLDDPDENIFQHIQEKLIQSGKEIVPLLEKYWEENKYNTLFLERIETLIDIIQFNEILEELKKWVSTENKILDGWIILTKWQFPGINKSQIKEKIEEIKNDVWIEIKEKKNDYIGDPNGLCAVWCIWWIDIKLSNPNIQSKILQELLFKEIINNYMSFKKLIRDYSSYITEISDKLLSKIDSNINFWINDKITSEQLVLLNKIIINDIKTLN